MKLFYTLLIALLMFSANIFAQEPIDTDGNGYRNISTLEELRWISENDSSWSWNFELDNDIDATDTKNWNVGDHDENPDTPDSAMGWKPLGVSNTYFAGKFNGNNFSVNNLFVNRPYEDNIGFFGFLNNSKISNLKIQNGFINGKNEVGCLAGRSINSKLMNCISSGTVYNNLNAYNGNSGGIVGHSYSTIIIGCSSNCDVFGMQSAGGIAGGIQRSSVYNSYSTGNINAEQKLGGLIGSLNNSSICNSYSTSNVTGLFTVGGLVGNSISSHISNTYSIGAVSGDDHVGGLIADDYNSIVYNSFWNIETSGQNNSFAGTAKSTLEMKDKATFSDAGWNFDFIWKIADDYPYLEIDTSVRPTDTDNDGFINISSLNHLRWISESGYDLEKNFELDNNINAAETKRWNDTLGFIPIGNNLGNWYKGTFKGNGYIIDSLYINRTLQNNVGLFGNVVRGIISDIGVANCYVKGQYNIGGLIGLANQSEIINCYSTGEIDGIAEISNFVGGLIGAAISYTNVSKCFSEANTYGNSYNGGLIGYIQTEVNVENCFSKGNVTGNNNLGGLIGGINTNSLVNNCYSTGNIIGKETVGGLIGTCMISKVCNSYCSGTVISKDQFAGGLIAKNIQQSTVINCYSHSSVTGISYVGGMIGHNNKYAEIINCYSTGSVDGQEKAGGLTGLNEGIVLNSFWDLESSGVNTSDAGTAKSTEEMKDLLTFTEVGWNFDFIWKIEDGYPTIEIDYNFRPTDTDDNNYLNIKTLNHLRWFSESGYDLDKNWELENDIDASGTKYWNNTLGFYPIGKNNYAFKGDFNGNGFSIDSLYINRPDQRYVGLFGYFETDFYSGSIQNMKITNSNVTGDDYVGGLVGYSYDANIINSSYTGIVSGIDDVGGLTGYSISTHINESFTSVEVDGSYFTGGLVGSLSKSLINKCYSNGQINGIKDVGGLIGKGGGSNISNSFSRADVSGEESNIGGFAGSIYSNSNVRYCYSTGIVTGDSLVGGLIGYSDSSTVKFSFWDIETSQIDSSDGGTPKTTAEMKTKSTFTDVGWDFDEIWYISTEINDGYPFFIGMDSIPSAVAERLISDSDIFIYPNPASDFIEISIDGAHVGGGNHQIEIYDVLGNVVFNSTPSLLRNATPQEGNLKIDVSHLPKGVYFVRIGDRIEKFVKM